MRRQSRSRTARRTRRYATPVGMRSAVMVSQERIATALLYAKGCKVGVLPARWCRCL